MSVYKQMKEVYSPNSQVPQYRLQLKQKIDGATGYIADKQGLWVSEFMDIINQRGDWAIREAVPTPLAFRNMMNMPT